MNSKDRPTGRQAGMHHADFLAFPVVLAGAARNGKKQDRAEMDTVSQKGLENESHLCAIKDEQEKTQPRRCFLGAALFHLA